MSLPIIAQSDSEVMVRIPWTLDGIASNVDGYFMVESSSKNQVFPYQLVRFQLRPAMTTMQIFDPYLKDQTAFTQWDPNDWMYQAWTCEKDAQYPEYRTHWMSAVHAYGYAWHCGYDTYTMDVRLKNGWSFDHAVVEPWPWLKNYSALWDTPAGRNGEPGVRVYWWMGAPDEDSGYYVWMWVKGPKGVPYK
jgi:hypothetical protein